MNLSRLVTGVVLGLLSLWAIFGFSQYWFAGLIGVFILLAAWEWAGLVKADRVAKCVYVVLLAVMCIVSVQYLHLVLYVGVAFWVIALGLMALPMSATRWLKNPWALYPIGFVVLVSCWSGAWVLHQQDRVQLFYVFMLVTLSDTGAYYAGRAWGRHKMAPQLSPKKTYEGLLGGLVVASIAGVIISLFMPQLSGVLPKVQMFGIGLMVIFTGVFGDLFESLIKRQVNIKDSGSLLPGHGGVLDRLDSLCAALPVAAVALTLIQ